jgi:hypothetical protein
MLSDYHPIPKVAAALWTTAWLGLFGWRFAVSLRKGDLEYDPRIKWALSKEYHSTHSATAAAQRRKKHRTRPKANNAKK